MKWLSLLAFCSALWSPLLGADYRSEIKYPVAVIDASPTIAGTPSVFAIQAAGEGRAALAWIESQSETSRSFAILVSVYSAESGRWSEPRRLDPAGELPPKAGSAELAFAVKDEKHWALAWTASSEDGSVGQGVAVAVSDDEGATWSAPRFLSLPSFAASSPSLCWSGEEGWKCVWLQRSPGALSPSPALCPLDWTSPVSFPGVRACDLGGLSFVHFPDGTELVSYRGIEADGTGDPWLLRRWDASWEETRRLGREGWKTAAPSSGDVRLALLPPRVAAAWYTEADGEARILATSSPDAGLRWTSVVRADLGHPTGAPDLLFLPDRSQLVLWVESKGDDESEPAGLYLRRYAPNGSTIAPALLERLGDRRLSGSPRLCLLSNREGADAELLAAFHVSASKPELRTLRLKLPPRGQIEEYDRSCNCGPSDQPGFSVRGRVVSASAAQGLLRLSHDAVPGILRKGELEAHADPAVVRAAKEGRGLLGRLERRQGEWWLSDVRLYAN